MKIIVLRLPLAIVARTSVVPTSHGFGFTKAIFKFKQFFKSSQSKQNETKSTIVTIYMSLHCCYKTQLPVNALLLLVKLSTQLVHLSPLLFAMNLKLIRT